MKKAVIFLILSIFLLNVASAYIDPGTGGYLVSSMWSYIGIFLAVAFAAVMCFFRNYLIAPVKKFWKEHRNYFFSGLVLLGILIYLAFVKFSIVRNVTNNTFVFNESLSGAHFYNPAKVAQGYNLYEGKLIDMNGNMIKNWSNIYLGVIDKNGDYYAQQCFECLKWGRYSWNGSVIWEKEMPIHHEILLTPDDKVITFSKEVHNYKGRNVEFDTILVFDKNGMLLDTWSTWVNFEYLKQFHKPLELERDPSFFIPEDHKKNKSIWGGNYDYYHLNSLSILPNNSLQGNYSAFTPGNWMISFRHGSMIFILDKDTKQVLWRAIDDQIRDGNLEGPHAPFMLPTGIIVVLDNGRYSGWSRVIAINPLTLGIQWQYNSSDFYSLSQGYVQNLKNNNLLITESEKGRVFEITPDKEIVWEFYHPDKQNENNSVDKEKWGRRQEIYRMTRYDKAFIDGVIKKNGI